MALTLNGALVSSLLGWSRPRLIVNISTDASTTYSFNSGPIAQVDNPESVLSVSVIKKSIDPLKRTLSVGQSVVTMILDARVNYMVQNEYLFGKKVEILFGDEQISEGAFAGFFTGVVVDAIPKENGTKLELKCKDSLNVLDDANIQGYWLNKHPLEIVEDIMEQIGLDSEQYDSSSLDPSSYPGHSHLCIASGSYQSSQGTTIGMGSRPFPSLTGIQQLGQIVDGMLFVDENGSAQFKAFDGTASSSADWTENDIDEIVQIDMIGTVVNRIGVYTHWEQRVGMYRQKFEQNDTDSQTNFGYPGGSSGRIREQAFEVPWIGAPSHLQEAIASSSDPGVGDTFPVGGGGFNGFAGTRFNTWRSAQSSDAQLSSADGRFAYLKLGDEIIECDVCTVDADRHGNIGVHDPATGTWTTVVVPAQGIYRVSERGARGTTAAAHAQGTHVFDMTIPVYMADSRLTRWSNGAPKVRVTTSLAQYAVQVGDLVTITTDRYKAFGHDGLDNTTKWEVVGKQVDVGENPKITWELVYASETGAPAPTVSEKTSPIVPALTANTVAAAILNGDVGENHVVSGLTVTQDSGLVGDIAAGIASGLVGRVVIETTVSFTFTASKDSYVSIGLINGEILVTETALGAGTPTLTNEQVMLAKVVTDGSGITTITDLRVLKALNGTKLVAETVAAAQLADSSVSYRIMNVEGMPGTGTINNVNLQKYTRG